MNGELDGYRTKLVTLMIGTNNTGENPDKWDGVSVHMGAFRGQCSDLLVPDKTNPRAWKWNRTELGEHFALCKDIRGKNLYVANHDSQLKAFATLKDAKWEPGVFLCYYPDIPLDGAAVKPENDLSYESVEHPANILFTSLVVKEDLEDVNPQRLKTIGFNMTPPGRILYGDLREKTIKSGDTYTLTLILDNTADEATVYNVDLTYTEGFEGPANYKVKLGPDSRRLIDVPVKCVSGSEKGRDDRVTCRVTAKGRETVVRSTARLKSKASDKKSIEEKEL